MFCDSGEILSSPPHSNRKVYLSTMTANITTDSRRSSVSKTIEPEAQPDTKLENQNTFTLEEPGVSYSVFKGNQKRCIIFHIALTAMILPLSSFIDYLAISAIAKNIKGLLEKMNLTITSYMIVSGITVTLVGDTAGQMVRIPFYAHTLELYLLANIALAV